MHMKMRKRLKGGERHRRDGPNVLIAGLGEHRFDRLIGLKSKFKVGGLGEHRSDGLIGLGSIFQIGELGGHISDGLLGLGFIF